MACSAAPMQIASLSGLVSSIAALHSVCQPNVCPALQPPLLKGSDAALNFECCFVVSDSQFDGVNLLLQISSVFAVSLLPEAARGIAGELRASGQTAALTSIVFSVISLEAFLNEAREVAHDVKENPSEPEVVAAFSR